MSKSFRAALLAAFFYFNLRKSAFMRRILSRK